MAAAFAPDAADRVAEAIANQPPGHVSWRQIAEIATPICGCVPSREWLAKNAAIKAAYAQRKATAEAAPTAPDGAKTPNGRAAERIARLERELAERDRLLAEYDERLVLHLKRAREANLTQEFLERPLTPIVRGAGKRRTGSRKGR